MDKYVDDTTSETLKSEQLTTLIPNYLANLSDWSSQN